MLNNKKNNEINKHLSDLLKLSLCQNNIDACPNCGSKSYIKHGKFNGIQRFRCKKCGKTFSLSTNFMWKYSKLKADKWFEYMNLVFKKYSLRECAEKLNITLKTSFKWRHKIISAFGKISTSSKLDGNVYIVKTFVKENFKGEKFIDEDERKNIWVISAKGENESYISKPVCTDRWDFKSFEDKIHSKINKNSYVVTYNDRIVRAIMKRHNKNLQYEDKSENTEFKMIGDRMYAWFYSFKGINTKYLSEYLNWFILNFTEKEYNYIKTMYSIC